MEISGNKYLHKKFKKQTSCSIFNEETNSQTSSFNNGQNNVSTNQKTEEKLSDEDNSNKRLKKDNVPNLKSTNCSYITVSGSPFISIGGIVSKIDIENNLNAKTVSNVISKSPEITNHELKENFSFDIKTSNAEKSSIEINYSKYLLSKRPNINSHNEETKNYTKNEDPTPETAEKKCSESTGGKYICTYCNLACSKPSVLQKHIRAHTNERPYPCVSCGFSFKTRSNLYKHCRSRTHANRVMGNKHMQESVDYDIDSAEKHAFDVSEESQERNIKTPIESIVTNIETIDHTWEQKTKPYKPKFHTAKLFFEENKVNDIVNLETKKDDVKSNPVFLQLRINDVISKNNSIVNSNDAVIIRRKTVENGYIEHSNTEYWQDYNKTEEPLNLTSKNRKRCLSDSENTHTTDKSLIKQLLLKNLSPDPDLQCQYCSMMFQTVPELEMHKLKYCSAYNKSNNVRFHRSSSVNVASILTQNKNAFDNIPHMHNTSFPLKSPGPFLGKTRLIENEKSEKYRFSFDENALLQHTQPESPSLSKYIPSPGFSPISPHIKKNPVKLFGGEVKITQTSGETRSFKIESETTMSKMNEPNNFSEYGTKLSENLVIKSSLQSGGTVLQNKSNYQQKTSLPSPNILRYDNSNLSPNLTLPIMGENKFNYDKIQSDRLLTIATISPNVRDSYSDTSSATSYEEKEKELYKSNLIDFSQKAIKLITPNLKPPTLSITGIVSMNDSIYSPVEVEKDKQHVDNINFAKKQISLQQKMTDTTPTNIYNPLNLLVDGKVIRYVPGIPGPVVEAESLNYPNNINSRIIKSPKEPLKSPQNEDYREKKDVFNHVTSTTILNGTKFEVKTPTIVVDQHENQSDVKMQVLSKIKSDFERKKEVERNECKTSTLCIPSSTPEKKEEIRKFVRPNSLALKPSSVAFKQHHGLTPTMFNQALISPDTPRVAKKFCQQYLNGNYFSYLGLKSSTKSVYCTLNKTQPFYVKHFKKLSMYSEWRQQESKIDSLSVSAYDSRQRQTKYTLAGKSRADLTVHSSYKFVISDTSPSKDENNCNSNAVLGGYESNEEYTYIRGRGRGRYVCDQCGIRCKKPSMLKKHLRTHSDDRPFTCEQCNFSFKTKGNLTKHMKSKAHSKKYMETSTSTGYSATTSSESEDDDDAESSDESTRLQEHEAAHCLLSLAQKGTPPPTQDNISSSSSTFNINEYPLLKDEKFLKNPEQITQVINTNFAKNKILDETSVTFRTTKHLSEMFKVNMSTNIDKYSKYFGKSCMVRPLTYPYQKNIENDPKDIPTEKQNYQERGVIKMVERNIENNKNEPIVIKQVLPKNDYNIQNLEGNLPTNILIRKRKLSTNTNLQTKISKPEEHFKPVDLSSTILISDSPVLDLSPASNSGTDINFNGALTRNEPIYFRKSPEINKINVDSNINSQRKFFHVLKDEQVQHNNERHYILEKPRNNSFSSTKSEQEYFMSYERQNLSPHQKCTNSFSGITKPFDDQNNDKTTEIIPYPSKSRHSSFSESNSSETFSQNSDVNDRIQKPSETIENPNVIYKSTNFDHQNDQDQSAMQTLAEIAIKQMKNEKNIMAKSVASEYLKLALKNEYNTSDSSSDNLKKNDAMKKASELIVKPEENKNCTICSKNFSKPSQLRLHMNIHYLERPFRCESCSVSFRTKGHLQKHERSAMHHNKLSSSPALSSSEPRPFKCSDCNIAFRIHGHLAKHLRSKMHIMKLECLAKIPFGLYAELERANSLLTEINTTDGDLCLESLKILARKLFSNDPNKLDQLSNVPEGRDS